MISYIVPSLEEVLQRYLITSVEFTVLEYGKIICRRLREASEILSLNEVWVFTSVKLNL